MQQGEVAAHENVIVLGSQLECWQDGDDLFLESWPRKFIRGFSLLMPRRLVAALASGVWNLIRR